MSTEPNFRPYEAKYLDFITELYNYYVIHSTATYQIRPLAASQLNESFHLSSPEVNAFIIEVAGQNAGFCLIKPYSAKEGYQHTYEVSIYLKPEYCHQGLGQQALKHLEARARECGLHVLLAGICAENEGSIRLFEKCNYTRCGYFKELGYKFDRRLDNVYYQKLV